MSRAMDALSTYLEEQEEKLSTFAVRIGRSPSTLSRVLSGQRDPSMDLARDVEKGTDGRVSKLQFLDLFECPEQSALQNGGGMTTRRDLSFARSLVHLSCVFSRRAGGLRNAPGASFLLLGSCGPPL